MKRWLNILLFSGLFLLTNAPGARSADMYVTDILKLAVRAQQGRSAEPVAVIESGQPVSLIRAEGDWALVKLSDNKEGWVHRKYLTSQPSSRSELKKLKTKHQNLVLQSAGLLEENEQLKDENKDLLETLASRRNELTSLTEDFKNLKNESTDFLNLKSAYEEASTQLSIQSDRVKKLEEELSRIEMNDSIVWFATGALVFLVGFLIGFSTKRQRKRPALR